MCWSASEFSDDGGEAAGEARAVGGHDTVGDGVIDAAGDCEAPSTTSVVTAVVSVALVTGPMRFVSTFSSEEEVCRGSLGATKT